MTSALLTTKEVASIFKVGTRTILMWVKAGRLKALRVGGPRSPARFTRDEVDRVLRR